MGNGEGQPKETSSAGAVRAADDVVDRRSCTRLIPRRSEGGYRRESVARRRFRAERSVDEALGQDQGAPARRLTEMSSMITCSLSDSPMTATGVEESA